MGSRVVVPESVTIPISNGDWILVKKRLNAGEVRAARARRYQEGPDGRLRVNPLNAQTTLCLAFLIDWSLTAPDDSPLTIRGEALEVVGRALDVIDDESFQEIYDAILAHEQAIDAARTQEKKTIPTGASGSSAISSSVSDSAGAMSGSASSTLMS